MQAKVTLTLLVSAPTLAQAPAIVEQALSEGTVGRTKVQLVHIDKVTER